MSNTLKPAETYTHTHTHTHTHTDKILLSPKQIGTVCFAKFFRFFIAPIFVIFCGLFCNIDSAYAVVVQGVTYPFSVTTTNQTSSSWSIYFYLGAKGTFYVDCGANGTLSGTGVSGGTISSTSVSQSTYTCSYSSSGAKTIQFGGAATEYNSNSNYGAIRFGGAADINNAKKISSISGNLAAVFPYLGTADSQTPNFRQLFRNATNLQSIPETLFNFSSNSVKPRSAMFRQVCGNCTSLTSIPENLFSKITPSNISNVFDETFSGCTNLTGYIPLSTFSGLVANYNGDLVMWNKPFNNTGLLTSCPTGTTQYVTGYESKWNTGNGNAVSCGESITCSSGTYLPANATSCSSCPSGRTCTGGTFAKKAPTDQGISYAVTYSCGNGSGTPPSSTTAARGVVFTTAANTCSKTGYTFSSWKIGTGITQPANTTFTWLYAADKTLTAQWTANTYTVTYNCGDGSGNAPANGTAVYDSTFTPASNTCTPPTGKHFNGWHISGTQTGDSVWGGFTWQYTGDKTLTAQYQQNTINMTFDGVSSTPESCVYSGTFVPPTPPARPGYIFTGWKVKTVSGPHVCGIPDLDTSISPVSSYGYTRLDGTAGSNESTYGLTTGSGQWAAQFSYGVVYGMANCNATYTSGVPGAAWNRVSTESSGKLCWCQATGFTPTSSSYTSGPQCTVSPESSTWVFTTYYGTVELCTSQCPSSCMNRTRNFSDFRIAIFGAVGL